MLSEALPIYSGGLGQVAGDQMKAASDLGVPVTGIGLLYGQGYFRQDFDAEGRQQVLYPVNEPGQLPIKPLRRANGEWLRIPIQLPGSKIWLRCWEVSVGRNKLYLLDTNDFANTAAQRGICSQLPEAANERQAHRAQALYQCARRGHAGDSKLAVVWCESNAKPLIDTANKMVVEGNGLLANR